MSRNDSSAFHGVDYEHGWCERWGLPCAGDVECCGQARKVRAVSLDYAQDVEAGLRSEVDRLRDIVEAAGAKFHELDLPVYADLCLNALAGDADA